MSIIAPVSYTHLDVYKRQEYDVPSKEEFKQRMRKTMQKYPYLVIEKEGRVYGYAYAGPFKERAAYDWACELSIYCLLYTSNYLKFLQMRIYQLN